jgi:hypothetical protein
MMSLKEVMVFNTVQHTTSFTPEYYEFPEANFTGSLTIPGTLDVYGLTASVTTLTLNFTGPRSAIQTFIGQKIGRTVTLSMSTISSGTTTTSGYFVTSSALPTDLWPYASYYVYGTVNDNGTLRGAEWLINTSGKMQITRWGATATFNSGVPVSFGQMSCSYISAN